MATKGPSKKASKTASKMALLKAQEDLRAEMVSTVGHTASGRQLLKACGGEEHQMALETKMKKRDLKALRTTYQTHPEIFDRMKTACDGEGSSDSSESDNLTKFVDSMDDAENESDCGTDNTANDHDEVAEASSPPVVGTKHQWEDSEVLNTDTKFKKGPNRTCQWLKASNFDDVTKDLLTTATSIYCCLVMTRAPFPETLIIETKLAKDAWHEASNMAELTIQLTPSLVKMMMKRTSHSQFFGFHTSRSTLTIMQNRDLAESLKEGSRFVFKDWETKRGIYKTNLIQSVINHMWFANRSNEGIVYAKYFDPLPVQTMALVLTAIECCIDKWMTGVKEDIKFSLVAYFPVYLLHLNSLQRFEEWTAAYKLFGKIGVNLLDIAWMHTGVDLFMTAVTIDSFTDDVFDDAI
ncbi:uncharacterized protein BJ212DRAFT_1301810 [Suillus subaureus]|uniref:DUF6532 domain-containing protein n=1 Tax=Suillus subaureus TaxID=48587 RepID=A0A9P7E5L2_9AGAM|nr:uncharacterized protein BJ212DRAFT_1301810 [Suillus subaureus]KAG1811780.1 hypothetical protein BJ212DRAFT_1301810 [Suillus subaureus]